MGRPPDIRVARRHHGAVGLVSAQVFADVFVRQRVVVLLFSQGVAGALIVSEEAEDGAVIGFERHVLMAAVGFDANDAAWIRVAIDAVFSQSSRLG